MSSPLNLEQITRNQIVAASKILRPEDINLLAPPNTLSKTVIAKRAGEIVALYVLGDFSHEAGLVTLGLKRFDTEPYFSGDPAFIGVGPQREGIGTQFMTRIGELLEVLATNLRRDIRHRIFTDRNANYGYDLFMRLEYDDVESSNHDGTDLHRMEKVYAAQTHELSPSEQVIVDNMQARVPALT